MLVSARVEGCTRCWSGQGLNVYKVLVRTRVEGCTRCWSGQGLRVVQGVGQCKS